MNPLSIVIVCGPTASGKSLLGLHLAEAMNGEIVSADSMQVYIHMDIGTDKPPVETRRRVRHHLIDLVYPDQSFDAFTYWKVASRAIRAMADLGKTPIVVGGTGLYLRALVHGVFTSPPIPRDIRTRLREEMELRGPPALYRELQRVDTAAASKIHPKDTFRVLRALEVYRATGRPISELRKAHGFSRTEYRALKLGIAMEREELYRRIDRRVHRMIERGLVEEVEGLLDKGYGRHLKPMQAIGYRQIGAYLDGEVSLDEAVTLIKRDSRRYAKRQMTWFRGDSGICWIHGRNPEKEAVRIAKNFLKV